MMAPEFKRKLLDLKGDAVAISVVRSPAGGCGKITLATALVHDLDVQDAYFDGILRTVPGKSETTTELRSCLMSPEVYQV
jgi:hypothetical protein